MVKTFNKENLNQKKQFFIDIIAKFCDKCGTPYTGSDLEIIQDTNISSIIHFSCTNCKSNHIATFIKPMGISNRMPINTDLDVEEISKFANKKETSLEDILEIYMYLKKRDKIEI
jgi:RNase P subunit RPR2